MNKIKNFFREEDAIGTIEIILILVVLIGLVVIFKEQLLDLMDSIFNDVSNTAGNL